MTRAQGIAFNALRSAGWQGLAVPTSPAHPQGGPVVLINGIGEIVYLLPTGQIIYLRDPVRHCREALSFTQGRKDISLPVYVYDIAHIQQLLNLTSNPPPMRGESRL